MILSIALGLTSYQPPAGEVRVISHEKRSIVPPEIQRRPNRTHGEKIRSAILAHIDQDEVSTIASLSEDMELTGSTIRRHLDILISEGVVERSPPMRGIYSTAEYWRAEK